MSRQREELNCGIIREFFAAAKGSKGGGGRGSLMHVCGTTLLTFLHFRGAATEQFAKKSVQLFASFRRNGQ